MVIGEINELNVDAAMSYPQLKDAGQVARAARIQRTLVLAAKQILYDVPRSPQRTRALNRLVDAGLLAAGCLSQEFYGTVEPQEEAPHANS